MLDIKSGYPFWAVKNGLICAFPDLKEDASSDVVVVGGGITGALIADGLGSGGIDVMVIEERDIAWGSTAASTALLQYEIDTHMVDLAKMYSEFNAVKAYKACAESIITLRDLCEEIGDVDFAMQESLYYASSSKDEADMREEYELRVKHDFDAEWLDSEGLEKRFGISAPCAILTKLAARVDPYRLASKLLNRLAGRGGKVYDRTVIDTITANEENVILKTTNGHHIHAQYVVMAAGYASQKWLKQSVAKNRSSYAFASDPITESELGPLASTMVWESARPYLYLRTTGDGRLIVGGDDDDMDIPARRDKRVGSKAEGLCEKVRQLFPHLPIYPAFSWAGTFAETKDGLPFFGEHQQYGRRVQFAMAYGGNGISYSMIGADLVRANIEGRQHPLADFFGFSRIDP